MFIYVNEVFGPNYVDSYSAFMIVNNNNMPLIYIAYNNNNNMSLKYIAYLLKHDINQKTED